MWLLLLLLLLPLPSQSTSIHRCIISGTTTFVDAPSKCPGGSVPTVENRNNQPRPPEGKPTRRAAIQDEREKVQTTSPEPARSAEQCNGLRGGDERRYRECIRTALRQQTRQIATARLSDVSRSYAGFTSLPQRRDGVVALFKDRSSRSAQWCEEIIRDVITLRSVEVIDDEESFVKGWSAGPSSLPLLSESFKVAKRDGSTYVEGSVAVLWKGVTPVVLFAHTPCATYDKDGAVCSIQPTPYVQISVQEVDGKSACDVSFIGRTYLQNFAGRVALLDFQRAR